MFAYSGWILFVLAVGVIVVSRRKNAALWSDHRVSENARMNVFCYLLMLFSDEVMCQSQRKRFEEWIASATSAPTDEEVFLASIVATQEVADRLAIGDGENSSLTFACEYVMQIRRSASGSGATPASPEPLTPLVPPSSNPSFVPPPASWALDENGNPFPGVAETAPINSSSAVKQTGRDQKA